RSPASRGGPPTDGRAPRPSRPAPSRAGPAPRSGLELAPPRVPPRTVQPAPGGGRWRALAAWDAARRRPAPRAAARPAPAGRRRAPARRGGGGAGGRRGAGGGGGGGPAAPEPRQASDAGRERAREPRVGGLRDAKARDRHEREEQHQRADVAQGAAEGPRD